MKFLNELQLQGYICRDLMLTKNEAGVDVCLFQIYTPPKQPIPTRQMPIVEVKEPMMFSCKAYGYLARCIAKKLTKGLLVLIYGSVVSMKYRASGTNETKWFYYISVREIYYRLETGEFLNVDGQKDVNQC